MSGPSLRVALLAAALALPALSGCAAIILAGKVAQTAQLVEIAAAAARRAMAAGEVSRIAAGQTVNGMLDGEDARLEEGHPFEAWLYEGRAGERIQIDLESDAFDAFLVFGRMVGGPQGTFEQIASDDDSGEGTNARLEVDLEESGTYSILATSVETGSGGPYRLTVGLLAAPPEAAPTAPEDGRGW
jgi:hypothetical protein